MSRLPAICSTILVLLAFNAASSQEPLRCEAGHLIGNPEDSLLARFGAGDPDFIEFQVGNLEAQFGVQPSASMSGGVLLRRGDRMAGADAAQYDPIERALFLTCLLYTSPSPRD